MIYIGTHHKTGTVLFEKVFREIASSYSLAYYQGAQRYLPPTTQVWFMELSKIHTEDFTEIGGIHVIRHPLEVICSGYRYHLVCQEPWCISTAYTPLQRKADVSATCPILYNFNGLSYQQKLSSLPEREGLLFEMNGRSFHTIMDMYNWDYGDNRFLNVKLEDVDNDYDGTFSRIFSFLGLDPSECLPIVRRYDLKRIAHEQVELNLHVTNKSGGWTWKKYFSDSSMLDEFHRTFPDDLITKLGYTLD